MLSLINASLSHAQHVITSVQHKENQLLTLNDADV